MSLQESKSITQQSIGFSYSFSIEKEVRKQGADLKYTDKIILRSDFSGHAATEEEAIVGLNKSRKLVLSEIDAAEIGKQ